MNNWPVNLKSNPTESQPEMPSLNAINTEPLLFDYTLEPSDCVNEDAILSARMLQTILLIREFETRVLREYDEKGLVHGPLHSSIGEEAVAVGVSAALKRNDTITSTHRGHHHFLAKALFYYLGDDYDPRQNSTPEKMQEVCNRTLAEILGLASGYSRGRGGSMHMADRESGILGTNAIVGGGIPIACGSAFTERLLKGDGISLTYFGEGASNQGVFFECMNMTALWNVPVIFLLENNLYSVATSVEQSCSVDPVARKALAAGIPSYVVDGMDPTAVRRCVAMARQHAREGKGPVLVECRTYRYKHQGGNTDGTGFGYRTKEEVESWRKKDPCIIYARQLMQRGVVTQEQIGFMHDIATQSITEACRFVDNQPQVDVSVVAEGLHSSGKELQSLVYMEPHSGGMTREVSYVKCISDTLRRRMETDDRIYIMGEEVGRLGGAFTATKGLYKQFPDRVFDSPISEAGFCGMALGAAITGAKPIIEIMYPDFSLVAADPLFNQIAKVRHVYGDQFDVPLVVRTRSAIGNGYGGQHCLDPAALYALYPGWRIVAPSTPYDVIGLLNTAIQSNDPVLFIEHADLYKIKGSVPEKDLDFAIPFGKARVLERGMDVIIVSYSFMASECEKALDELESRGIHCTFIDLRTLDYMHIDWLALERYLDLAGKMLICEQSPHNGSLGSMIADRLHRECFDSLDAPIYRLGGKNVPVPVSKAMEAACIIHLDDIVNEVVKIHEVG